MNIKWIAATLTASAIGVAIAQAPKIDEARVNNSLKMQIEQIEESSGKKPDAKEQAELRKNIIKVMQQADLLKSLAIKEGLDKQPDVMNRFANFEASFYASEYTLKVKNSIVLSDTDVLMAYRNLNREVMLQQIAFNSKEDALKALTLLRQGISFADLAKQQPNPQPFPKEWTKITPDFPFASSVKDMVQNEISAEPIFSAEDQKYYLLRIADTRSAGAPPFTELTAEDLNALKQIVRMEKTQSKLNEIYKANGIEP